MSHNLLPTREERAGAQAPAAPAPPATSRGSTAGAGKSKLYRRRSSVEQSRTLAQQDSPYLGRLSRAEAEMIFDAGRDAVVDALLRLDGRVRELSGPAPTERRAR